MIIEDNMQVVDKTTFDGLYGTLGACPRFTPFDDKKTYLVAETEAVGWHGWPIQDALDKIKREYPEGTRVRFLRLLTEHGASEEKRRYLFLLGKDAEGEYYVHLDGEIKLFDTLFLSRVENEETSPAETDFDVAFDRARTFFDNTDASCNQPDPSDVYPEENACRHF